MKHAYKIFSIASLFAAAAMGIGIASADAQTGYFTGRARMNHLASGYMAYSFQPLYGTWMQSPMTRNVALARQPYPVTAIEQWHAATMPMAASSTTASTAANTMALRPPYPVTAIEHWHAGLAATRPPYPVTAIEQWHRAGGRLAFPGTNFVPWRPGMVVRQAPAASSDSFSRAR
jgi:hypothetical protein